MEIFVAKCSFNIKELNKNIKKGQIIIFEDEEIKHRAIKKSVVKAVNYVIIEKESRNLTVSDLKKKLDEKGIKYPKNAKKQELEDLING